MKISLFLRAARANFLPASVIPFFTGAALAFREGEYMSPAIFVLGLSGVVSAHLAGNLLNDHYDDKNHADIKGGQSPFSGGSGVIREGLVTSDKMLSLAVGMFSAAAICGAVIFAVIRDPVFPGIMALAALLAYGYTAPPLRLAYRRLGEADIFLLFGVILVMASYYLFSGKFTLHALAASLPVSFLVSAVILCNEVPDADADALCGKRTLISLPGKEKAYILYAAAVALSYLSILLNAGLGIVPPLALGLAVAYIPGIIAAGILKRAYDDPEKLMKAGALTAGLHALAGSGFIAGILLR